MNTRWILVCGMAMALGLIGGCGGSTAGVHAVVPGAERQMSAQVPSGGQYNLYRAMMNERSKPPYVEKIWSTSAGSAERVGFRWSSLKANKWDPEALHLIAYAGNQTLDLGPYRNREVKYLWAGNEGDVMSYFDSEGRAKAGKTVTMQ